MKKSQASFARIGLALFLTLPLVAPADAQYSDLGADTCLRCHRDAITLAVFGGAHGRPDQARGPFGRSQLQCEACHGPGGRHSKRMDRDDKHPDVVRFGRATASPASVRNEVCIECHADTTATSWHGSAHDAADVACADCHRSHAESDTTVTGNKQSEFCFTCHQSQRTAAAMPYTHPTAAGTMTCNDCHTPHGGSAEFQLVRNTINETCYVCHADKRGPLLWEHAPVAEDCSACHDSHGSNHPAMLTQRGPYLCQTCHAQVGHPSLAYDGDGLPTGATPSIFLVGRHCLNCHTQIHGSNHPSGAKLMR